MNRFVLGCAVAVLFATSCGPKKADNPPVAGPFDAPAAQSPARTATATLPDGIDAAQTSTDATYGYTKDYPIKVGMKDEYSGPAASQVYLRHLRDKHYKPLKFRRLASTGGGPDDHMLDIYELTSSTGEKITVYVDMYHPENTPLSQKAPVGLYFWK